MPDPLSSTQIQRQYTVAFLFQNQRNRKNVIESSCLEEPGNFTHYKDNGRSRLRDKGIEVKHSQNTPFLVGLDWIVLS